MIVPLMHAQLYDRVCTQNNGYILMLWACTPSPLVELCCRSSAHSKREAETMALGLLTSALNNLVPGRVLWRQFVLAILHQASVPIDLLHDIRAWMPR